MVQQAARDTARFHGELHAVYAVREKLNLRERQQLRQNLSLARQAGAMVARLEEKDAASGVIRFAAGHGITQVYLQKDPQRLRWNVSPGILDRLLQNAGSIDIQVFPNR